MAIRARIIPRRTSRSDIEGQGIVLGGLGVALGVLLWMAAGGALPFDFGPFATAQSAPDSSADSLLAETEPAAGAVSP